MPIIPPYFKRKLPAMSRPHEAPKPTTTSTTNTTTATTLPIRKHKFPTPKLRLHLNDLAHEGTSIFLSNTKGVEDIEAQIQNVLNLLYTSDDPIPGTRSITIVLREMNGVAYTTGIDLDHDHKEMHFNLDYIAGITNNKKNPPSSSLPREEILGVICHELVHCFQWAAQGTCPGGLIEGIADWVRLRAGLAAKHWKQDAKGDWDAGYQHTGYFLEYLEQKFGQGTVRRINGGLRKGEYDEEKVFGECCGGRKVGDLWEEYKEELKKGKGTQAGVDSDESDGDDVSEPVPTHAVQRQ